MMGKVEAGSKLTCRIYIVSQYDALYSLFPITINYFVFLECCFNQFHFHTFAFPHEVKLHKIFISYGQSLQYYN